MAISLSSITKNNVKKPPRICCYGASGIGKTTFGASAPSPIFIQLEDGLGQIKIPSFPICKSYDEVMECIGVLYQEEHEYQSVVIDSLDWLEPLIWAHTCSMWTDKKGNNLRIASIEDAGYGKGYVEANNYWKQFLEGIDALRNDRGMTPIFLSHMAMVKVEDPSHQSYDAISLKLHKRAAALISEYCDIILYAAIHTSIASDDEGFGRKRKRALSNGSRIMHTVGQPSFLAKNRYNLVSPLEFSWEAMMEALNG